VTNTDDRVSRIQAQWRRERPDIDPSPQGVIGRLHRVADALHRRIDAVLAEHGLSRGDFDVLASLRRAGEPFSLPAGELAAHTMITSGGLTKRVDRLVERGMLRRDSHAADGRVRTIALTAEGRSVVDAAFDAHMAGEHRLIAELGDDAIELEAILRRWLVVLGED